MKTVYKYPVGDIQIPKGAKILTAGIQGDDILIWAEVDTEQVLEHRTVHVYGTGHLIPDNACYIATLFDWNGFVWHIYEVV
jgi:hypothetical protein